MLVVRRQVVERVVEVERLVGMSDAAVAEMQAKSRAEADAIR
jgi:hypothetical protein